MSTHEPLIDDVADGADDPFTFLEIRRELTHDFRDDELGLRSLLELPERVLPIDWRARRSLRCIAAKDEIFAA